MVNIVNIITLIASFIFLPSLVAADDTPSLSAPAAYCLHHGYSLDYNSDNIPICVINEQISCTISMFYDKSCGKDFAKENLPRRKEGEQVYLDFESCEDDLVVKEPKYLLDPPTCEKPSLDVLGWISSLFS